MRWHSSPVYISIVLILAATTGVQANKTKDELKQELEKINPHCTNDIDCYKLYSQIDSLKADEADPNSIDETDDAYKTKYSPSKTTYENEFKSAINMAERVLDDIKRNMADPEISFETKRKLEEYQDKINNAISSGSKLQITQAAEAYDPSEISRILSNDREAQNEARANLKGIEQTPAPPQSAKERELLYEKSNIEYALRSKNNQQIREANSNYEKYAKKRRDLESEADKIMFELYNELAQGNVDPDTRAQHLETIAQIKEAKERSNNYELEQILKSPRNMGDHPPSEAHSQPGQVTVTFAAVAAAIGDLESWIASYEKEIERRNLIRELESAEKSRNRDQLKEALKDYSIYKRDRDELEARLRAELRNMEIMLSTNSLSKRDRTELENEMSTLRDSLDRDNLSGVRSKLDLWQAKKKAFFNRIDDNQSVFDQINNRLSLAASSYSNLSSRRGIEANRYMSRLLNALNSRNSQEGAYAIKEFDNYLSERARWERQLKDKKTKYEKALNSGELHSSMRKALQMQIAELGKAIEEEDIPGMRAVYSQSSDDLLLGSWTNSDNDYWSDLFDNDWI